MNPNTHSNRTGIDNFTESVVIPAPDPRGIAVADSALGVEEGCGDGGW